MGATVSQAEDDLAAVIQVLRHWAAAEPLVARVFVFGSRVAGTPGPGSDIDVAVELDATASDEEADLRWIDHAAGWRSELESRLPWELDLEWYDPGGSTPTISKGLENGHIQVWPETLIHG